MRSRPVSAISPFLLAGALSLAACSSGSPTPSPAPTPTPTPNVGPVFTSAATANVAENTTGTVYTATATDANGDAISYSLAGGNDQGKFAITAGGVLTFLSSPDFESPQDSNADNVYEVVIRASDGKTSTDLSLKITVTNVDEQDFTTGFINDWSVKLDQIAPSPAAAHGVYVLHSTPTVASESMAFYYDRGTGQHSDVSGLHAPSQTLSVAASPTIATDKRMYALARVNGEIRIVVNIVSGACNCVRNLDSSTWDAVIMRIPVPAPAAAGLVTGWIGFGPDGYLYVAVGDGTINGETTDFTGSPASRLGKILRIDVSRDDFPADPDRNYGIPADNPYATGGAGAPEVWALGLHRPSAVRFEPSGELFFTDSGQVREEINLLPVNTPRLNYGWPWFDGTQQRLAGSSAGYTWPVAEYAHGTGPMEGSSILAGGVYTGPIASLANRYVFADAGSAILWSIPKSSLVLGSTVPASAFKTHAVAPFPSITRIGFDRAGDLYVTTPVGSGDRLFTLVAKP